MAAMKILAVEPEDENKYSIYESDYLQPARLSDLGEAGASLAVLGQQMDLEARERERVGSATIMEVDVENESGEVGRQVVM